MEKEVINKNWLSDVARGDLATGCASVKESSGGNREREEQLEHAIKRIELCTKKNAHFLRGAVQEELIWEAFQGE